MSSSNTIKYSVSLDSPKVYLKKGDMKIGIFTSNYGPTNTSGYWNGYTPGPSGYTIYINKASQGPSIFSPANDSELIATIAHPSLGGNSITSATGALEWVNSNPDMVAVNFDYPVINPDGSLFFYDSGFTASYPRTGSVVNDLSPQSTPNNGTLSPNVSWSANSYGSFVFSGNGFLEIPYGFFNPDSGSPFSVSVWFRTNSEGVIFSQQSQSNIETTSGSVPAIYVDSSGSLRTSCFLGGSVNNQSVFGTVNDGRWHEVTVTYESLVQTSYLDGAFAATLSKTQTSYSSDYYYFLGAGRSTGWSGISTNYFTGEIAVARFYNRALNSTEVSNNYNSLNLRFNPTTTTTTSTSTTTTSTSSTTTTTTLPPTTTTTTSTSTTSTSTSTTSTSSSTTTTTTSPAGTVTFSQTFTNNVAPSAAIQTAWDTFRSQLTGSYTTFKFFSNLSTGVTVTDAVNVQSLANGLRTATITSVTINSVSWRVGVGCTNQSGITAVEFSNIGSCTGSSTYALRPRIGNANWGGVNGSTVGAATQTITLQFY